ncbi:MAG: HAD family hydrolase, partial [Oscillospiraceae bacterium]|nr:HAD family hydrolase [Oscillospiraceae bacterium]
DIVDHIGRRGEECLMAGNNPVDDMAALKAGISGYLVTDCIENPGDLPLEDYTHGSFRELEAYLAGLPALR